MGLPPPCRHPRPRDCTMHPHCPACTPAPSGSTAFWNKLLPHLAATLDPEIAPCIRIVRLVLQRLQVALLFGISCSPTLPPPSTPRLHHASALSGLYSSAFR